MDERIEIVEGDITRQEVDALVNAANESLLGGGGVDGAIHRGAGPQLLEVCRQIGGCPTGKARITPGFRLPAAHVIHTVGPRWRGGGRGEAELLASCYRSVFEIVRRERLRTVAFPSISTGAYGYPVSRAARIAVEETRRFLGENDDVALVRFVCFDETTRRAYEEALGGS